MGCLLLLFVSQSYSHCVISYLILSSYVPYSWRDHELTGDERFEDALAALMDVAQCTAEEKLEISSFFGVNACVIPTESVSSKHVAYLPEIPNAQRSLPRFIRTSSSRVLPSPSTSTARLATVDDVESPPSRADGSPTSPPTRMSNAGASRSSVRGSVSGVALGLERVSAPSHSDDQGRDRISAPAPPQTKSTSRRMQLQLPRLSSGKHLDNPDEMA